MLALISAGQAIALGLIATGDLSIGSRQSDLKAELAETKKALAAYRKLDYAFGYNLFTEASDIHNDDCTAKSRQALLLLGYEIVQQQSGFLMAHQGPVYSFVECYDANKVLVYAALGPTGRDYVAYRNKLGEMLAMQMADDVQMKN